MDAFDIAVIGAGPAGVAAALRGAQQEARVCLIEQERIGASCLRKGLVPFKAAMAPFAGDGADPSENGAVDGNRLLDTVAQVGESVAMNWQASLEDLGVDLCRGRATLLSPRLIQVDAAEGSREVNTKKIILATGSCPVAPPTVPFEGDSIISVDDVFRSAKIPGSVLFWGAGPNGCELATLFGRLGSKVFLCDPAPRLLTGQDPEVIAAVEQFLKQQKVKLLLNKKLVSYYKNNDLLDITLDGGVKFQVEKMVLNLSRQGNSSALDCGRLGIRLGQAREVLVNEVLETSTAGVFAAGSIIGRASSAGRSEEEGRVAADNALGKTRPFNADWVPFVVYTQPQIATVGCFAAEAHHKGLRAVEGRCEAGRLDYALIQSKPGGFFKVVAEKKSGLVIGAQIVSPRASELIMLVLLAMKKGLKVGALASLGGDGSNENQGIREAARACSRALKAPAKTP